MSRWRFRHGREKLTGPVLQLEAFCRNLTKEFEDVYVFT